MFILIFLLTILILVVIHEFGHFISAKRFGVKVLEFGFGIPPKIFGKRIGETIYSLNWLPFGGFVRLLGEDEVDQKILENERSFAYQKVWKRIVMVGAGVIMNLLLAWVLFYIVLINQNFKIVYPAFEPSLVIDRVEKGMPADLAGIKPGEKIVSINGQKINDIDLAIKEIKSSDKPLELNLADIDGKVIKTVRVQTKEIAPNDKRIGVAFTPLPFKQYNTPLEKVFSGITYSWDATRYTFMGLGRLFSDLGSGDFKKASTQVAGPVGLVSITRDIVNVGKEATLFYIWFMGTLSLTLAIFNVLPIPALDGGRLFFLIIEALTKRKVKPDFERKVHAVGMAVLLMLIALITYSDLSKIDFASAIKNLLPH